MSISRVHHWLLLGVLFSLASCSQGHKGPEIKKYPVTPVKGSVMIDGEPQAGVIIRCIPTGAFDYPGLSPETLGATTNEQGQYTLGTYEPADGVPAGEYALTFIWPTRSLRPSTRDGAELKNDRLKGKYAKAKGSPLKITVEEGSPQEVDPVELKTK
ncbi:MAG: hypothetical protein U0872_05325 [Planctomycetaceae bacterium]